MPIKKIRGLLTALGAVAILAACATPDNYYDPLEPINRLTFAFNEKLDRYAVKPVTQAYVNYVPGPAKQGVSNFTSNIGDVTSIIGNTMQGEMKKAASDVGRVLINTIFGMFGLVDWASDLGLEKHDRTIGKALGRWGIGTGPYLVLPVLGPNTLRDTSDLAFNWTVGVPAQFNTIGSVSYGIAGGVDARAGLLPYEKTLEEQLIFDKYAYIRDIFLQRRHNDVYEGNPPEPLRLGPPDIEDVIPADNEYNKDDRQEDNPALQ